MNPTPSPRERAPFEDLIDLASERVGGLALETSDDFFAEMANMLKIEPAVFIPGKYTDFGKWMDGWESRRKRNLSPGNDHDWCVVKLGLPGVIRGVNVDTAFFTGNFPEACAIDACESEGKPDAKTTWSEILARSILRGNAENLFPIANPKRWTHLRLRIYPDGGVARFRVHGEVLPDEAKLRSSKEPVDLVAAANGGVVILANDMHYGVKDNLIFPGRARVMGEGWETRRKRGPVTPDWIVLKTATTGTVTKLEIDTNHFKGNYPESCSVEVLRHPGRDLSAAEIRSRTDLNWKELLPRTKLEAHQQRYFEAELREGVSAGGVDYVRLNIFPDGGISRFRVYGRPIVG